VSPSDAESLQRIEVLYFLKDAESQAIFMTRERIVLQVDEIKEIL
jgi:hypothetical protein